MKLSHKDLVKLGRYEADQGYSLNQIETDFSKKGIKRRDAVRALEEIEYHKKRELLKSQQEAETSKKAAASGKQLSAGSAQTTEKKSSFWLWFILLMLIGIVLYLYFSGIINFDWLYSINFK